jgi:hypothetical protein
MNGPSHAPPSSPKMGRFGVTGAPQIATQEPADLRPLIEFERYSNKIEWKPFKRALNPADSLTSAIKPP